MKGFLAVFFTVVLALVVLVNMDRPRIPSKAPEIFEKTGLRNTVTVVYLRNRMYDTLFEVAVFSTVVTGIKAFHRSRVREVRDLGERIFSKIARFVAFFTGVSSLYLALTGHLYPGGGFTAGVAGGTALLVFGMGEGIEEFERKLERFRMELLERLLVISIVLSFFIEIHFPDLISVVPLQSFLIYLKVMGGTWLITYNFMKHRGIV